MEKLSFTKSIPGAKMVGDCYKHEERAKVKTEEKKINPGTNGINVS